ncbi:SMI1/KNR4 family protein [Streptomyces sp. N2A]|uniref:SMI1/KNR4 family protein n=1 Tax=Streptomyces sp. N2A TaxID=3073936 RepID=UPI00286FF521|nr:SMI1/KNR4 family protein [Streptomyces sp. N2A]
MARVVVDPLEVVLPDQVSGLQNLWLRLARLSIMWRQVVQEVFPEAGFHEPTQASEIVEAEKRLGRSLPAELKQLLLESNGVIGRTYVDTVWTMDQIVKQNLLFWSDASFAQLYMPFDALLFFGDNGGGDQFAFVQKPERPDVFVWEHESDSRRWVANNLRDYLGRSLRASGDDWYRL